MFSYMKELFFMPLMMLLKALLEVTDQQVYRELVIGKEDDSFYKGYLLISQLRPMPGSG